MSQPGFSGPLASRPATAVRPLQPPRRNIETPSRREETELKLAALQKDYSELHAGLFEASQVYRRLCAPGLVRRGDFEIAGETFAARHLPGDFVIVKESGNGVTIALGDIAGKGLAAGMWTTLLLGLIALHGANSAQPHAIVSGVNRDLSRMSLGSPLATLFLARLDPATGRIDYCSAGHPPTLLLRADGQLESLSEGGTLLGVLPEASFGQGTAQLGFGDLMLAYSDGVLEARNYADEEFGSSQLEHELRRARGASAGAMLFSLLGSVQDFAGARRQADDMSLVVVRCGRN